MFGSNVNPNILMSLFVGSVMLLLLVLDFVEYAAGCGVNNMVCNF